jgi:phosphoserine phosphatase
MNIAIYDFDGTYVNVQTVPHVFKLWKQLEYDQKVYKKHWSKIVRWYLLHKLKIGWNKETFRKNAMAKTIDLLHHLSDTELKKFMEQLYQSLIPFIRTDLKKQLQEDKKKDYYTVLLSGSFDIILEPFLKEGFDEVIGTPSKKDGKRLNSRSVEIIIRDKKLDAFIERFGAKQITHTKAYADSYYDLPLLLHVNKGICYHPDKKLKDACIINKLVIIE